MMMIPRLRFCGGCRNLEFTITITIDFQIVYRLADRHVDNYSGFQPGVRVPLGHVSCCQGVRRKTLDLPVLVSTSSNAFPPTISVLAGKTIVKNIFAKTDNANTFLLLTMLLLSYSLFLIK